VANPLPVPEAALSHHLKTLHPSMQEWIANKRIPPVLLLTGQGGVGKRTVAHFLAQWIFCERVGLASGTTEGAEGSGLDLFGGGSEAPKASDSTLPCGECTQCVRALKGSWVDFTEIHAENAEEGDKGSLKIDQFRKIKESMGFGGHEGSYRIFLIPDADRMTAQAANSVLKLLEEPPRGWVFLLTASDPTLVLPTVLSRCQQLKLKPFDTETLKKLLSASGVLGEKQKLGAALGGGSWGRALQLASDEISERRQLLFDFLERPQGALNALVDWASQSDSAFNLFSDQLELLCLDLIHWSLSDEAPGAFAWTNFDGAMALKNHAEILLRLLKRPERARAFWIARSERIAQSRKEALTPLNRKLLIQDILIPWLEVAS
jgi:DNA polymerase-3 subunit delta'